MNKPIPKKQLRHFGIFIGLAFPILIGWLLPFLSGHGFRLWTLLIGFPCLILGLLAPPLLFYPFKLWMATGHILGWLNSHIILGIVFVFVLQPIAILMRFTGYDPLRQRRSSQQSYREDTHTHRTDFTRIF